MIRRDMHEANRRSWNAVTPAHNSHKQDQAAFLRGGGSTLFPEEIELLGDLGGKRLVHLQCNCGQDTLSLAQRGAVVTGVDISDEAIGVARQLSSDTGVPGTFVRSDVYDWFETARAAGERFDVVFASYGALCWLSDIDTWARGVASVLAPGGRLVVVEFHPVLMMFDEKKQMRFSYFRDGEPITWGGVTDYVGIAEGALSPSGHTAGVTDFKNPHGDWSVDWGIGEVLGAVLAAGLRIETFREYPYSNGCKLLDEMVVTEGNRFTLPPGVPALPLMFSLAASA
jgi:SAM-dependent methyltransferase